MTDTTDQPPLPTRRQLRAAERGRGTQTTGAAVSPPAAPVPTVDASIAVCATELPNRRSTRAAEHALSTTELPTRRSARAAEGASRRRPSVRDVTAAVAGALTGAITVPLRALGDVVPTTRVVPLTATTVAACLVVSVASP